MEERRIEGFAQEVQKRAWCTECGTVVGSHQVSGEDVSVLWLLRLRRPELEDRDWELAAPGLILPLNTLQSGPKEAADE